jgi:hypothetical protein
MSRDDWHVRYDRGCFECESGDYCYVEQTTDRRGDLRSRWRCDECGDERLVA